MVNWKCTLMHVTANSTRVCRSLRRSAATLLPCFLHSPLPPDPDDTSSACDLRSPKWIRCGRSTGSTCVPHRSRREVGQANMTTIALSAPLAGFVLPITDVPDPVFAGGLAGDGVAIDPTNEVVYAPCAGEVGLMPAGRHALTLRTGGFELLLHVGIDTVHLNGAGFELLITNGAQVAAGQPLMRFSLDR